jgi:signal transduction histidine kinase/ActR/RegA family two-component response regulator
LAARVGFRACWSEPIISSTGKVLGTFAIYLNESREPRPSELELISSCAQLASIAIERKQVEQTLRQKEEQVRHSQKMEAVGRLAGGIAHDFNNLLTAILGYARLILDELKEDERMRADMVEIIHAAERAGGLTRQMLAFGRKQLAQVKSLDLNDVVLNMDRLLRRTIGENIELVNRLEPHVDAVMGDPGHFEQVVLNLAINARDAMPDGGRLIIETRNVNLDDKHCSRLVGVTPGNYVMLRLEDTGMGMTDEVRERAFEPFFTTKGLDKGSGMGLAMVYGIVHQFKGAIELNSTVGVGTEFRLYFPRSAEPAERYSHPADNDTLRGIETVLVVEDADSVRRLSVRILRSLGYTVLHACNGKEALHVSKKFKGPIHLLLTDLMMPHIGGRELAIRFQESRPDAKVLYTSGFSPGTLTDYNATERITPFIPKPFTKEGLAQKIREVMDNGSASGTSEQRSRRERILT